MFNVTLTAANQTQGGGPLTLAYKLSHVDFGAAQFVVADTGRQVVFDVSTPQTPILIEQLTDVEPHLHLELQRTNAWMPARGDAVENLGAVERLVGDIEVTATPKIGGVRDALYVRNAAGGYLFDVADRDHPREVQRFSSPAWFEGFALSRKAAAVHAATGEIELYALTAQHFVGDQTT